MKYRKRVGWLAVAFFAATLPAAMAAADAPVAAARPKARLKAQKARPDPVIHQLIVKLRSPVATEKIAALGRTPLDHTPLDHTHVAALSTLAGVKLQSVRPMSGGAGVVATEGPVSLARAQEIAARLAADPAVEYAEPDMPVRAVATPSDTGFVGRQWNLQAAGTSFVSTGLTGGTKTLSNGGGANFQAAWDSTVGQNTVRVAVIDSGVVSTHPDLSGVLLGGYDFVSSSIGSLPANFTANDGDGRDADPSDPGDWITAAEKAAYPQCDDGVSGDTPSSWHGTHMAGLIAAQWGGSVAGTSLAGAAPSVRIVPVRVLGKCGGVTSDVIDAMRWAAGLSVSGVPANANPAQVLSLSLGGGSCSTAMQAAVNEIIAANVSIVAANGNDSAGTAMAPANCNGVVGVTAHVINGENADYANVGTTTAISAPGGGQGTLLAAANLTSADSAYYLWSTVVFGPTTPTSTYVAAGTSCASGCTGAAVSGFTGTSPATPQVAAALALMLSANPALTPTQLRAVVRASAQPHPNGGFCRYEMNLCGAGLLDANRAVLMASAAAPAADAGPDQRVIAGSVVTLNGSALALGGKTVGSYLWTVESGSATLTGATNASASFIAPTAGSTVLLRLTATDNAAVSGYDFALVRVNSRPTLQEHATSATAGQALSMNIVGSDADLDPLTYALAPGASLPSGATLSSAGALSWSNPSVGTHTFYVVANDGLESSASARVTITVPTSSAKGGGGALHGSMVLLLWCVIWANQWRRSAQIARKRRR